VIFDSYVSLPEGNTKDQQPPKATLEYNFYPPPGGPRSLRVSPRERDRWGVGWWTNAGVVKKTIRWIWKSIRTIKKLQVAWEQMRCLKQGTGHILGSDVTYQHGNPTNNFPGS
jgi:hypothetical protein